MNMLRHRDAAVGRSPDASTTPKSARRRTAKRNRNQLREVALYLNLGAAFSAATLLLLPHSDDVRRPPPTFAIFLPHTESEGGPIHLTTLFFVEDHGEGWDLSHRGGDRKTQEDYRRSHSLKKPKGIALELYGNLSGPVPHDDQWYVTIYLPSADAVITACNTNYDGEDFPDSLRGTTCTLNSPNPNPAVQITGTLPAGSKTFRLALQLANIDGVGYLTTHTRAEASFPMLPSSPKSKLLVGVTYWIPGGQKISWAGSQPSYFAGSQTSWDYQLGGDGPNPMVYQPAASGRREDIVADDETRRFFAGALVGLAGAALMAALQAAVVRRD